MEWETTRANYIKLESLNLGRQWLKSNLINWSNCTRIRNAEQCVNTAPFWYCFSSSASSFLMLIHFTFANVRGRARSLNFTRTMYHFSVFILRKCEDGTEREIEHQMCASKKEIERRKFKWLWARVKSIPPTTKCARMFAIRMENCVHFLRARLHLGGVRVCVLVKKLWPTQYKTRSELFFGIYCALTHQTIHSQLTDIHALDSLNFIPWTSLANIVLLWMFQPKFPRKQLYYSMPTNDAAAAGDHHHTRNGAHEKKIQTIFRFSFFLNALEVGMRFARNQFHLE